MQVGRIEKIFKWDNNTNLDGEIKMGQYKNEQDTGRNCEIGGEW
jgi:hypothetical protein